MRFSFFAFLFFFFLFLGEVGGNDFHQATSDSQISQTYIERDIYTPFASRWSRKLEIRIYFLFCLFFSGASLYSTWFVLGLGV